MKKLLSILFITLSTVAYSQQTVDFEHVSGGATMTITGRTPQSFNNAIVTYSSDATSFALRINDQVVVFKITDHITINNVLMTTQTPAQIVTLLVTSVFQSGGGDVVGFSDSLAALRALIPHPDTVQFAGALSITDIRSTYHRVTLGGTYLADVHYSGSDLFKTSFDSTRIFLTGSLWATPHNSDTTKKILVYNPSTKEVEQTYWPVLGTTYTMALANPITNGTAKGIYFGSPTTGKLGYLSQNSTDFNYDSATKTFTSGSFRANGGTTNPLIGSNNGNLLQVENGLIPNFDKQENLGQSNLRWGAVQTWALVVGRTTTAASTYTITAFDQTVIFTGSTATWTYPSVQDGRLLKLVNQGTGALTIPTTTTTNGVTVTTLAAGSIMGVLYDTSTSTWRKVE